MNWNNFIEDVCCKDLSSLSPEQRKAALCFWYDAEMNSGGFCGYQDCYPETDLDELEDALREIANDEIADNLRKAIDEGEEDDWEETDMKFYAFEPSLADYLMKYVDDNVNIFGNNTEHELIEEYKSNFSMMITDYDDYGSSIKVMKSNRAAKRNREIAEIIESKHPELKSDFSSLMDNDDARIKSWVAHHIIEVMNYDRDVNLKALDIIIDYAENNEDSMERLGNSVWLKRYFEKHPEDNVQGWVYPSEYPE